MGKAKMLTQHIPTWAPHHLNQALPACLTNPQISAIRISLDRAAQATTDRPPLKGVIWLRTLRKEATREVHHLATTNRITTILLTTKAHQVDMDRMLPTLRTRLYREEEVPHTRLRTPHIHLITNSLRMVTNPRRSHPINLHTEVEVEDILDRDIVVDIRSRLGYALSPSRSPFIHVLSWISTMVAGRWDLSNARIDDDMGRMRNRIV